MHDTSWYHKVFLQSPEWKAARAYVIQRDGHKCRICGLESGLQVHHRHYDDENLCNPDDLVTLCKTCHDTMHKVLDRYQKLHAEKGVILYDDLGELMAKAVLLFYHESFLPRHINVLSAGYKLIQKIGMEIMISLTGQYEYVIIDNCEKKDVIRSPIDVHYSLAAQEKISAFQDIIIRKQRRAGKSDAEIRRYLGMSEQSYRKRAQKMGW